MRVDAGLARYYRCVSSERASREQSDSETISEGALSCVVGDAGDGKAWWLGTDLLRLIASTAYTRAAFGASEVPVMCCLA